MSAQSKNSIITGVKNTIVALEVLKIPQRIRDLEDRPSGVRGGGSSSSGGASSDSFKTISVSGQSDVVADSATDTLTFVAGTNMTITTNSTNDTITFDASGGAGSGIVRVIATSSGNFTAGATASTDYVYFLAGAHTPTLPTAVGNTNRYTFKNNHSANITFNTTSGQTVDGAGLILAPEDSVDLVSNNANWFIT